MYLLLLLAQNLPTELQVCPHPQTHRVGVFWGPNPGGLAVSQAKILLHQKSSISLSLTMKPNLILFDQIKTPLRLPEQQIVSEQVPRHPPHLVSTELRGFFQSFKVPLQPSNKLKIISHSNLSSTTLILDKHSSTVSTINTGVVYLTSTLWRPASTHTHGFVTKEFMKIDEDSHTRDYTIVYIRFQVQTPPFSTCN